MTLPHSDACFVAPYPAATTEAWLDGHNRAFVFFGGVPQSILYDNDKCLVSRILSDGTPATNAGVQRAAVPLPLRGPLRPCASHLSHPGCIKNADRSAGTGDGTICAVRRA